MFHGKEGGRERRGEWGGAIYEVLMHEIAFQADKRFPEASVCGILFVITFTVGMFLEHILSGWLGVGAVIL